MKHDEAFRMAFRRAVTCFPFPAVTVQTGEGPVVPGSFCAVSCDPPIVALTFARNHGLLPDGKFSISGPAKLHCRTLECKEVGDRVMLFAEVQRLEMEEGTLRLDHPFIESAESLETFVTSWRTGVLPKSSWTHSAHVAVTGYYAFDSDPETVFAAMKRGILHFNTCSGVVNGPDSGYHETLTRFWSNTITLAVRDAGPNSRLESAAVAVRRFGEDRDLPSLFYSFDVVRDRRARAEWIAPDREPSPEWWVPQGRDETRMK